MHPDAYPVISGPADAELRVKGSRFLALLAPAADEAAAEAFRAAVVLEHPDASHHCWAFSLGHPAAPRVRHADDGEPAGSAGPPIARALAGSGLSDVVCVVVRWFGGTKLGVGGLIRAYGDAARLALDAAPRGERLRSVRLAGRFPYALEPPLRGLLAECGGSLRAQAHGEDVSWEVELPVSAVAEFRRRSGDLARGESPFAVGDEPADAG